MLNIIIIIDTIVVTNTIIIYRDIYIYIYKYIYIYTPLCVYTYAYGCYVYANVYIEWDVTYTSKSRKIYRQSYCGNLLSIPVEGALKSQRRVYKRCALDATSTVKGSHQLGLRSKCSRAQHDTSLAPCCSSIAVL